VALLPGTAAPAGALSPVARVDLSFDAVGGKRPPNIVETRIAGEARLSFNSAPRDNSDEDADAASGKIVVEIDVLTPHPQTLRVVLKVTGGSYERKSSGDSQAQLLVSIVRAEDGDGDQLKGCPAASRGLVTVRRTASRASYVLQLAACDLRFGQVASAGPNSRVHVSFSPKCLRSTAGRKASCGDRTGKPKPKSPAAGTFRLVRAEVTNAAPNELKINAPAGTARWDHCCDGGGWKAVYRFKVPKTLVAGRTATVSVSLRFESVEPKQPLGLQISVLAPDFRKDLPIHFPERPSGSATYKVPISAGYATAGELTIVIGFEQGQVIYHYRR